MNLLIPTDRRVRSGQRLRGGYVVQSVTTTELNLDPAEAVEWVGVHDRRWVKAQAAYLLKAEVPLIEVDASLKLLSYYRYESHWHRTPVQRVDVCVTSRPRMLSPVGQQRASDELGYTTGTDVLDAGECVDIAELGAVWEHGSTARHRTAHADRVAAERKAREGLGTEARIVAARQAARLANVDVRDEIRLLRKFLKEHRSERSIATQLDKVERRAYRETT